MVASSVRAVSGFSCMCRIVSDTVRRAQPLEEDWAAANNVCRAKVKGRLPTGPVTKTRATSSQASL